MKRVLELKAALQDEKLSKKTLAEKLEAQLDENSRIQKELDWERTRRVRLKGKTDHWRQQCLRKRVPGWRTAAPSP